MARAICMAVAFLLAAAVVQASQCSSGGWCPSSNKLKNTVSLIQTKLQTNVPERGAVERTESMQSSNDPQQVQRRKKQSAMTSDYTSGGDHNEGGGVKAVTRDDGMSWLDTSPFDKVGQHWDGSLKEQISLLEESDSSRCDNWKPLTAMPKLRRWAIMGSCGRGTGKAMRDYAVYGQTFAKLPLPHFFCIKNPDGSIDDQDEFRKRFGADRVTSIENWPVGDDVDRLLEPFGFSHVYFHKSGQPDGVLSKQAVNLVHAVFDGTCPHGDRHARIGPEVPGRTPIVPYMVQPFPKHGADSRRSLDIPPDSTVLCRYGGHDTFNIPYVHDAVVASMSRRRDLVFLFVNTDQFTKATRNIRFLDAMSAEEEKATFIRTCDAMIHARSYGETFGLAIAEFATMGRRVITNQVSPDALHMVELGERALVYHDYQSALDIFLNFDRNAHLDPAWDGYSAYNASNTMKTFYNVFLA